MYHAALHDREFGRIGLGRHDLVVGVTAHASGRPRVSFGLFLGVYRGQIGLFLIGVAGAAIDLLVLVRMRHGRNVLVAHRALKRAMHALFEFLPRDVQLADFAVRARHGEAFIAVTAQAYRFVGGGRRCFGGFCVGGCGRENLRRCRGDKDDTCQQSSAVHAHDFRLPIIFTTNLLLLVSNFLVPLQL